MKKLLISLGGVLVIVVLLFVYNMTQSQNKTGSGEVGFPKGPISIYLPSSPGGTSDALCRMFEKLAPKYVGEPVVVVNKAGAGGVIATTEFQSVKPDGYTVLLGLSGVFTTVPHMRKVDYDINNFKHVIGLTYEPNFLVVKANSPYKTFKDLVAAYSNGKTLVYGHNGNGSLLHLDQAMIYEQAGIKAEGVPYGGTNESLSALLGGHVQAIAMGPGELKPHLEEGTLRALCVFGEERDPREVFADIPSSTELGYNANFAVWKFFSVPKDTPDQVVGKLYSLFEAMLNDPEFVQYAENNALIVIPYKGDEIAARIEEENKLGQEIVQSLGIGEK